MKIFILPGGTSPYGQNKKHRDYYRDITNHLTQAHPGAVVEMVTFPGQKPLRGDRLGELEFVSSVDALRSLVEHNRNDDIRLVCSCWGCQIGAAVCAEIGKSVHKALFWAPVPFWKLYEVCVLDNSLWAGQEEIRGVKVTPRILCGITPFEISIQKILDTHCCVAAGTHDEYVSPPALTYFQSLVPQRSNFTFRSLRGCGHNVLATDDAWADFRKQALQWILE